MLQSEHVYRVSPSGRQLGHNRRNQCTHLLHIDGGQSFIQILCLNERTVSDMRVLSLPQFRRSIHGVIENDVYFRYVAHPGYVTQSLQLQA